MSRLLAVAAAVAALAAAGTAGARPTARCPHLAGSVTYARGGQDYVLSLASCTARATERSAPPSERLPGVRTNGARAHVQRIWVRGRLVFAHAETGPVVPIRLSGDGRWLFFAVDPYASASIAADGLDLLVVSTRGGPVHHLGVMLLYRDYLTWCGGELVYAQGGDRIAIHDKRLLAAAPPDWRPRPLWNDPTRTFASPACVPGGKAVAVLTQRSGTNAYFFATRWQLWRVGLDGSHTLLDAPPPGYADESPSWSADGSSLLFVRERNGYGRLMLLARKRVYGPLANLGYSLGYYGHHDWSVAWRP